MLVLDWLLVLLNRLLLKQLLLGLCMEPLDGATPIKLDVVLTLGDLLVLIEVKGWLWLLLKWLLNTLICLLSEHWELLGLWVRGCSLAKIVAGRI